MLTLVGDWSLCQTDMSGISSQQDSTRIHAWVQLPGEVSILKLCGRSQYP